MIDILSYASGMPFVFSTTLVKGASIIVLTGTLAQWKIAIADGLTAESKVRGCYTTLYGLFIDENLNLWVDYKVSAGKDQYLLLTYSGK